MLGIGVWEIALVAAVALIALGPERIRSAAQAAGRLAGKARKNLDGLRDDLDIWQENNKPRPDGRSENDT